MILAIPVAQDDGLASPVDARFGRAGGFLLVDTATRQTRFVANEQNLQAAQGAGIQAAQAIAGAGAGILLTPHCGPKAFRVLKAAGVEVFLGAAATAAELLARYESGALAGAEAANVEGHW